MISETSFARGYSSFWLEFTPWINDYTSFLNKGIIERIYQPLKSTDEPIHRSINNVIAFILFQNKVKYNDANISKAFKEAKSIVENFPRNGLESYELEETQKTIIEKQANRLIEVYQNKNIIFSPQFNGCGILSNCQGDLYYDSTLVEIKAGERNILSSDIKQCLVYCALSWLSKSLLVYKNIEIFNPRQGILWNSSVHEIISSVSSLPTEDLFEQIGKYLYDASEDIVL